MRAKTTSRRGVTNKPAPRAATTRSPVSIRRADAEQPGRPMAVGQPPAALWETESPPIVVPPVETLVVETPTPSAAVVDKPWAEIGVGAFAVLLAASVFLPWYHNAGGTVSGWSSGTWGPVIFFLSLAALAIVVLRRMQVAIAFPVESPLIVEGIGWICVIGLILKRYFQPIVFDTKLSSDGWIFASLTCALGLALLAGFASSNTVFVLRPRWFGARDGWIGSTVLVIALAAGVTFGFTNTSVPVAAPVKPSPAASQTKGLPACAKRYGLPTPQGFKPYIGYDTASCIAAWTTSFGLNQAYSRFAGALHSAGWTVTANPPQAGQLSARLTKKGCGLVTVANAKLSERDVVIVEAVVAPCASPAPSK